MLASCRPFDAIRLAAVLHRSRCWLELLSLSQGRIIGRFRTKLLMPGPRAATIGRVSNLGLLSVGICRAVILLRPFPPSSSSALIAKSIVLLRRRPELRAPHPTTEDWHDDRRLIHLALGYASASLRARAEKSRLRRRSDYFLQAARALYGYAARLSASSDRRRHRLYSNKAEKSFLLLFNLKKSSSASSGRFSCMGYASIRLKCSTVTASRPPV